MTVKELMNFLSKQNPEAKVITTATQHVEYVEECDPCDNYKSHIESAIGISSKYNYGISIPVTVLCTK